MSREVLRHTFDEVAELYDRARPEYPDVLFDDLWELGQLGPDASLLEIGCGTGKATRALVRRGFTRLVCVELGPNLAAVARRNFVDAPNVRVITSDFETWEPEAGESRFDAVFAAAAWHWLDPAVRFDRAARVLKSGGVLAIVSGGHAFPDQFDPFFTEIQACYHAIGEGYDSWPPPTPDEVPDERADIERSGLFGDVVVKRYLRSAEYGAEQYIDLLETFSGHRVIAPANRARLYAEIRRLINARPTPRVRKHSLAILHVARRLG